MLEQEKIH
jgi:hypothetical protein